MVLLYWLMDRELCLHPAQYRKVEICAVSYKKCYTTLKGQYADTVHTGSIPYSIVSQYPTMLYLVLSLQITVQVCWPSTEIKELFDVCNVCSRNTSATDYQCFTYTISLYGFSWWHCSITSLQMLSRGTEADFMDTSSWGAKFNDEWTPSCLNSFTDLAIFGSRKISKNG